MNNINSKLGTPLKAQHKFGRNGKTTTWSLAPWVVAMLYYAHIQQKCLPNIIHVNHVFFTLLFLFPSRSHLSELNSCCDIHCIPSYHTFSDSTHPAPSKIFTDHISPKKKWESLCHLNSGNKIPCRGWAIGILNYIVLLEDYNPSNTGKL